MLTEFSLPFIPGGEPLKIAPKTVKQNDLVLLADTAHAIKRISGQLCAKKLSTLASDLEERAHE